MNIGRYRVLKELGRGAVGIVYLAHDPNLDLPVALKVLRTDRELPEPFVKRFLSEAKALGRLEHPGIVRVFNVDEDRGSVFIAMEFVEGESLDALMKAKAFSPREIAELGIAVAEALEDAHRKGIVHRDIKPSNMLVRRDGRVKITDFGIAHIDDASSQAMTQAGEVLGTPAYMSPEQVLGKPADGRSDLFSLGIVLYEMAVRARPFGGESLGAVFHEITTSEPAPPETRNAAIPRPLGAVIMRCLRKDAAERFASAGAVAAALKACFPGAPAESAAPQPVPAAGFPVRWIAAGGALLLAAVAVFWLAGSRPSRPPAGGSATAPPAVAPAERPRSVLAIESAPAGASVFVDGSFRGAAPLRLDVARGKHEVRLTMAGHDDWEAQVLAEDPEVPLNVRMVPVGVPR